MTAHAALLRWVERVVAPRSETPRLEQCGGICVRRDGIFARRILREFHRGAIRQRRILGGFATSWRNSAAIRNSLSGRPERPDTGGRTPALLPRDGGAKGRSVAGACHGRTPDRRRVLSRCGGDLEA